MLNELLVNQLKRHEGLRLTPYRCTSGKLTIGYGRNLEDSGISKAEADILLHNDINSIKHVCDLSFNWYKNLNDARKGVVINMVFNLGYIGFKKFKKMIYHMSMSDFDIAAKEMINSRWAKQVGYRARELSEQMRTGEYRG